MYRTECIKHHLKGYNAKEMRSITQESSRGLTFKNTVQQQNTFKFAEFTGGNVNQYIKHLANVLSFKILF